ncbi:MAG: helix-turn-helix domain-containing protein [Acutalibacteraceae bacterium]|nr:helix-turn-helix transcriptional regulator [Bacillota bacterium]
MAFHKNLYQLRKSSGLSQEELAEKLNVSRQTISKWELGESSPDMEKLIILSDFFQISLDELVLDRKPAPQTPPENNTSADVPKSHPILDKILTESNIRFFKKGLKLLAYLAVAIFAIDLLSMIVFAVLKLFGVM